MVQPETLEHKIDELLRSLGGLDRLRELARLSSLDHLVNLHLLSHLTKLDKIEGLDKLKDLDQLKGLERLNDLKVMEKLDQLAKLSELRNLEQLSQLNKLSELQELRSLQDLKQLEALSQLDKLSELRRLDALGSLQDLGGLERLDHLKYLANLDRLNELTALTKLDGLNGLGELLEKHGDKFAKLRHLESLDNLHLLDQLKNLDKLDRLDELSRLDELKAIGHLAEAPPALPLAPVVAQVLTSKRSFTDHATSFLLDLIRTVVVAAILILVLLMPQGRKVTENAAAFLGFGQGHQVNWALQILSQASGESFPQYWTDFQKRLEAESALVFDTRAPWSLNQRYQKLHSVLSYDFKYQGQSLRERVRQDVEQRLSKFESDWKERLSLEIGQVMLRQGENQKLILWNQLKDLAVGGRWFDVIKISASSSNDRFAQEAAIVALVHLQLSDPSKLADIMESSP
jgi:hypothetical protein